MSNWTKEWTNDFQGLLALSLTASRRIRSRSQRGVIVAPQPVSLAHFVGEYTLLKKFTKRILWSCTVTVLFRETFETFENEGQTMGDSLPQRGTPDL